MSIKCYKASVTPEMIMSSWLYKFIYLQMWNVLHVTHLFTQCRPKANEVTILTACCSFVSYFIDSGDRSRVISTQDIVLSTCEVTLKPQPCTRHDCGSEIVSIMAVSDFIDDGDRMTMILTKPAVSQSSLWKSYDPPDAIVSDLPWDFGLYTFNIHFLKIPWSMDSYLAPQLDSI